MFFLSNRYGPALRQSGQQGAAENAADAELVKGFAAHWEIERHAQRQTPAHSLAVGLDEWETLVRGRGPTQGLGPSTCLTTHTK